MSNKNTEHHRLPKSRCSEFGINPDDFRNKILKTEKEHRAYHTIFSDLALEEAVKKIILEWFPGPTLFSPNLIKNKNLRSYYKQVWFEKNKKSAKENYQCENCGCQLVEFGKINGVLEFNCENCGQDQKWSCVLCKKPSKLEIDKEKNIYICKKCLINLIEKGIHLPKKYRMYSNKIKEIYKNFF